MLPEGSTHKKCDQRTTVLELRARVMYAGPGTHRMASGVCQMQNMPEIYLRDDEQISYHMRRQKHEGERKEERRRTCAYRVRQMVQHGTRNC